jgi:hypothetical protein
MKKKLAYKFVYKNKTIEGVMEIDLGRFEGQYSRAQYALDSMVMTSMIPFMPKQTGTFINMTQGMSQAIAGSGKVVAAAPPMGRYLYEGKVMVDSVTGKGPAKIPLSTGEYILRYRKGAKLKATDRPLQYSKRANRDATDHWFEPAMRKDGKGGLKRQRNWPEVVK